MLPFLAQELSLRELERRAGDRAHRAQVLRKAGLAVDLGAFPDLAVADDRNPVLRRLLCPLDLGKLLEKVLTWLASRKRPTSRKYSACSPSRRAWAVLMIVLRFVDRYYHTPLKVKLACLLNQISEKLVK